MRHHGAAPSEMPATTIAAVLLSTAGVAAEAVAETHAPPQCETPRRTPTRITQQQHSPAAASSSGQDAGCASACVRNNGINRDIWVQADRSTVEGSARHSRLKAITRLEAAGNRPKRNAFSDKKGRGSVDEHGVRDAGVVCPPCVGSGYGEGTRRFAAGEDRAPGVSSCGSLRARVELISRQRSGDIHIELVLW
jgi:hypothetical protein